MELITTFRDKTRTALLNRPRTLSLQQIADETGLTVHWLNAFSKGVSPNPGVVSVETLYVYLTTREQQV